ncbi:hypothetical protein NMY22_g15083 [Coprinellus aureogranulatus]|nr:hypothetical protein NMY22_g15083 [Coprinellus aureogranulatus]
MLHFKANPSRSESGVEYGRKYWKAHWESLGTPTKRHNDFILRLVQEVALTPPLQIAFAAYPCTMDCPPLVNPYWDTTSPPHFYHHFSAVTKVWSYILEDLPDRAAFMSADARKRNLLTRVVTWSKARWPAGVLRMPVGSPKTARQSENSRGISDLLEVVYQKSLPQPDPPAHRCIVMHGMFRLLQTESRDDAVLGRDYLVNRWVHHLSLCIGSQHDGDGTAVLKFLQTPYTTSGPTPCAVGLFRMDIPDPDYQIESAMRAINTRFPGLIDPVSWADDPKNETIAEETENGLRLELTVCGFDGLVSYRHVQCAAFNVPHVLRSENRRGQVSGWLSESLHVQHNTTGKTTV